MATTARGTSSLLYFREQTDFDTVEATGQTAKFVLLPFFTFDTTPILDREPSDLIDGSGALPSELIDGLESGTFRGEVPLGMSSLGYWLKTMFGAPTTSNGTTHWQHLFRATANPTLVWATLQKYLPDIAKGYRCKSAMMTGFSVSSRKIGRRARMSIEGIMVSETKNNVEADTAGIDLSATDVMPVGFEGKVQVDGVDLSSAVIGIDFTCRNGVQLDQELMNGIATAGDFLPPQYAVEGSLTLRVQDTTFYDYAVAGTKIALKATFTLSTDARVIFTMDDVKLSRSSPVVSGPGPLTETYNFVAGKPSSGSLYPMEVHLRNPLTDYNRA